MRTCTDLFQVDWSTSQKPNKILEKLKHTLSKLRCHEVVELSKYRFKVTIDSDLQCEIELMTIQNAPFITLVRVLRNKIQTVENFFCRSVLYDEVKLQAKFTQLECLI